MLETFRVARRARTSFTLTLLLGVALVGTTAHLHGQLQLQPPGQGVTTTPSHPQARPAPEPQSLGWLSLFGGPATDMAQAVVAHPQGGSFACGLTQPDLSSGADVWVARLSPFGVPVWQESIGGASHDEANAILVTNDGGCLLAGRTASAGSGDFDGWIARLDAAGSVLWQRSYGGPLDDQFFAAAPSPDGFFVGGVLRDAVSGNDAWVLEIDGAGDIIWQQRFDAALEDGINAMSATPDGGVIFCADSNSALPAPEAPAVPGIPFFRPWIVKLTGDGVASWQMTYNYSGGDNWRTIVPLDDGGYVVAGQILVTGFFGGDVWVARLDEVGNVVWDWRFGDNFGMLQNDIGVSVQPTVDGGFVVLGSTESAGAGSQDVWVLKLDGNGSLLWDKTIGGTGFDGGVALASTPSGEWLLAGRMQAGAPGNTDAFVARMLADGSTGVGCEFNSPTAPRVWTDVLMVDPVELAPTATGVVPVDTGFGVVGMRNATLLCPMW
jgi:hypothetical protein